MQAQEFHSSEKESNLYKNSLEKLLGVVLTLSPCVVKSLAGVQSEMDISEGLRVGKDTQGNGILHIRCDSHEYQRISNELKNQVISRNSSTKTNNNKC